MKASRCLHLANPITLHCHIIGAPPGSLYCSLILQFPLSLSTLRADFMASTLGIQTSPPPRRIECGWAACMPHVQCCLEISQSSPSASLYSRSSFTTRPSEVHTPIFGLPLPSYVLRSLSPWALYSAVCTLSTKLVLGPHPLSRRVKQRVYFLLSRDDFLIHTLGWKWPARWVPSRRC